MAKFTDKEQYLFDQNYYAYEQIAKDLKGANQIKTENDVFEVIFDLYKELNINELKKRNNRNILKIKQEFDQLKQKKGLKK